MKQLVVDLNCDMGEGTGNDEQLMPFISSANVACGFHAGDEETIKTTIQLAKEHGVAIGAHPSFYDRENFGRSNQTLPPEEVYKIVLQQIQLLQSFTSEANAKLHHVKPHGALYNMAAKNKSLAAAIVQAVKDSNPSLILYAPDKSEMIIQAEEAAIRTCCEVFADRTYQRDGSLTPRTQTNALIESVKESMVQVWKMVKEQKVSTVGGGEISIHAETICIHGDGKHAVEFAKSLFKVLKDEGISIQSP
jgi:5-oxoprolinase (ATP-hydrolysing) subunit A